MHLLVKAVLMPLKVTLLAERPVAKRADEGFAAGVLLEVIP